MLQVYQQANRKSSVGRRNWVNWDTSQGSLKVSTVVGESFRKPPAFAMCRLVLWVHRPTHWRRQTESGGSAPVQGVACTRIGFTFWTVICLFVFSLLIFEASSTFCIWTLFSFKTGFSFCWRRRTERCLNTLRYDAQHTVSKARSVCRCPQS